jgi:P2 family phage contractile tail tube protein
MALPRILKNFNVFYNGVSFAGQVTELTLPKLTRKVDSFRPGGVNGPLSVDLGMEALELVHTYAGYMREILNDFGLAKIDGAMLRFAGAFEHEDTGDVDAIEVVVRGRHKDIDFGTAKAGEKSDFKVTSELTYYKLSINGETVVEIDLLNMIENVNGTDMLAAQRKAVGL